MRIFASLALLIFLVTPARAEDPAEVLQDILADLSDLWVPLHRDPNQAMARSMAVLGLPVTVVLDPDGQEIARLRGDADWASDSAKAIISALLAAS